jgi:hypothetical protein
MPLNRHDVIKAIDDATGSNRRIDCMFHIARGGDPDPVATTHGVMTFADEYAIQTDETISAFAHRRSVPFYSKDVDILLWMMPLDWRYSLKRDGFDGDARAEVVGGVGGGMAIHHYPALAIMAAWLRCLEANHAA